MAEENENLKKEVSTAKKGEEKEVRKRKSSALKRDLQSKQRNFKNRSFQSAVKTSILSLKAEIKNTEKKNVGKRLNKIFSLMDKGVKKGVFKKNKANRIKSRLFQEAKLSL